VPSPSSSDAVSLPPDAQLLLELLSADGSGAGNLSLRRQSRLSDDAYRDAVEELVKAGVVRRGPGRGGSLRLALGSTPTASTIAARPRRRDMAEEELTPAFSLAGPGGLFESKQSVNP